MKTRNALATALACAMAGTVTFAGTAHSPGGHQAGQARGAGKATARAHATITGEGVTGTAEIVEMDGVAREEFDLVELFIVRHAIDPEVAPRAMDTPSRDIARMIARNQVMPVGPREDADRRVVEVTATLDAESAAIAARSPGSISSIRSWCSS